MKQICGGYLFKIKHVRLGNLETGWARDSGRYKSVPYTQTTLAVTDAAVGWFLATTSSPLASPDALGVGCLGRKQSQ